MSITCSIDSFSLPELFQLIGNNSKSGRAIVETPLCHLTARRKGIYYIWFQNGYLIAVSNCLNQKGLIELIAQRKWLNSAIISRLRKLCPIGVPLGIYLHKMKLLNREQLNLIFQLQLHQVYRLFQLTEGKLRFDNFAELPDRILTIPWLEMTGHRLETKAATIYALRLMESSENFRTQLPALNQILTRLAIEPNIKLTTIEREVWNWADSNTSLLKIAKIIDRPFYKVQTAAFRLIAVGLVETIFISDYSWKTTNQTKELTTLTKEGSRFSTNKRL